MKLNFICSVFHCGYLLNEKNTDKTSQQHSHSGMTKISCTAECCEVVMMYWLPCIPILIQNLYIAAGAMKESDEKNVSSQLGSKCSLGTGLQPGAFETSVNSIFLVK